MIIQEHDFRVYKETMIDTVIADAKVHKLNKTYGHSGHILRLRNSSQSAAQGNIPAPSASYKLRHRLQSSAQQA
jgi:PBP1b-binding outer membrane lipoprotein LpoB